ncbi:MAG: tripartite tricarboxylate transporter TctB family protein [Hyphomicrobiales bacterium]
MLTKDRVFGLLFLALSIAYGVEAQRIELYFGSAGSDFTARTFPTFLSFAGGIVAFLMIVLPAARGEDQGDGFQAKFLWGKTAILCLVMVGYGLTIKSIGFLIATSAFLMIGYAILGERNIKVLILASIPVVMVFQFLLHSVLGVYIYDPFLVAIGVVE